MGLEYAVGVTQCHAVVGLTSGVDASQQRKKQAVPWMKGGCRMLA